MIPTKVGMKKGRFTLGLQLWIPKPNTNPKINMVYHIHTFVVFSKCIHGVQCVGFRVHIP